MFYEKKKNSHMCSILEKCVSQNIIVGVFVVYCETTFLSILV